ncbi:MAG: hypothetical protein QF687_02965 [Nitrospinaceae bacterium]|nr:hypothetical protein [Nitrospinaceae bacterium]
MATNAVFGINSNLDTQDIITKMKSQASTVTFFKFQNISCLPGKQTKSRSHYPTLHLTKTNWINSI